MSLEIAFFNTKSYEKRFFDAANQNFQFKIHYFDTPLNKETLKQLRGQRVICTFVNDAITAELVPELVQKGVKLIALRCAGYNQIDLKTAKGKLIIVRVPAYSPYAVAEHAVGMMLCLNRKLHLAYLRTRENNFSIDGLMGFDMYGKTMGIIGCGQIGQKAAQILQGFGMHLLGYDIIRERVAETKIAFAELDEIYRVCDIISLHCPLTPDTYHMIDRKAFAKMKEGVMLINTGRGGLVHTGDLIEALKAKKVGSAGLDVYEEEGAVFYQDLSESFIPDDQLARLQTFPNVLITAHQGFFTREALMNIAQTTLQNISDYAAGNPLLNEVVV